ncbi:HEXXH motif domain-containing protein [Streptomyces capillispiralis]|uniref:HEXXH motif-containing protein n=2 Tax=Streptomyces capillispiralis TaxID=68182 RepID=A0A561TBP6_9ACTN|nr:HEXXH motif-containing protein [Streptomyces capillispiralis]GHH92072.1 HEXXH motif domain-containing protein [Streptomyces capillispiralis]
MNAPRTAPFRMPEPLFAELAAGGGSAQAVAFLEQGERARRLLLLRTLLNRLGDVPTPLTPAAEAWRVFKEAAGRAPGPVERLLLAPTTGAWIAHLLRRLHGTATGPELWSEAGRLNTLAVAASLHAGTETVLRVPLHDGTLPLPGLGLARLPDAAAGLTEGTARTRAGELTLTGPGRAGGPASLTCRPASVPVGEEPPAGTGWLPLRTLTAGSAAIPLDDLDPYRDLDDPIPPARLDDDEAAAWQRLFDEATAILARRPGAGPGRLDPAVIRSVVPWERTGLLPPPPPDVRVSASSGDSYGAMVIARPSSPLALAEALVHEFQHSKLAALLHLFPLLDDDRAERHYAPWRPDPRHLTGLLHGAYAFTGVAGFWRDRLSDPEHRGTAAYHFALRRTQSRLVVRTLLTSGRLTADGHGLVGGLARTLDGWLREPVDPAAAARARTAAALHRTEWRLRNVAPPAHHEPDGHSVPPGGEPVPPPLSAPLRLRTDRAPWPDHRTHAFALPPTDPATPDEHLAAGDAAAALAGYDEGLRREPGDPHLLAGWIVARAALDRGPGARRLLARPELARPGPARPALARPDLARPEPVRPGPRG